jgi:hypothetical protein
MRCPVRLSNKDPITGLPAGREVHGIGAEEIFRGICERVRNTIHDVRGQKSLRCLCIAVEGAFQ